MTIIFYYFDNALGWCIVVGYVGRHTIYTNIREGSDLISDAAHIYLCTYIYEKDRDRRRARARTICPEQLASDIMADDVYLLCAYNITLETMCSTYICARAHVLYEYI